MKQHRSIYTSRLIVWYSCFSERDMDIQTIGFLFAIPAPCTGNLGRVRNRLAYRAWIGSNIPCDMAPYQFDLQ